MKWTLLPPPYTRYDRSSTHPETGERRLDALRLHDRMPVILETGDWPVWLGDQPGDYTALLRAAPIGTVRLWPVSRAVNSVRSNGAELLDRVDDPHAPPPSDAPAGENPA